MFSVNTDLKLIFGSNYSLGESNITSPRRTFQKLDDDFSNTGAL